MSLRLFVAIELPGAARAVLREAVVDFKNRLGSIDAGGSFRWVAPHNWHLTLRFLGNIDDEAAVRVREAMQAPLSAAPFAITLRRLGSFPPRGRPRVLHVAVADGVEAMRALRDRIDERLRPLCTWEPETRPFTPHLTLARFNAGPERQKFNPVEYSRLVETAPFPEVRLEVSHATLFSSVTLPSGPVYTAEARAALRS